MTADAAAPPAAAALNSRLAALLTALLDGITPPPGWGPDGQCLAEITLLTTVIAEISQPGTTAAKALALYAKTFILLTRLGPEGFTRLLTGGPE